MQNALSGMDGAPPAPVQQPQQGGNAVQGQGPAPAQGQFPAPSHQQTVAALKQFDAIEQELTALLSDPDVGKSDLKSKIIDGTTRLVAMGILTPAAAVTQLGTVPEKPFEQRAWLEQHLIQTVVVANHLLEAHAQGFQGQEPDNMAGPSSDGHLDTIAGLMGQYKGQ